MRLQLFPMHMTFLRRTNYKFYALTKQCRYIVAQMWLANTAQNYMASLGRWRKLALLLFVIIALILYAWPSWFRLRSTTPILSVLDMCLEAKLRKFHTDAENYDSLINDITRDGSHYKYYPYVGNGYVGLGVDPSSNLYIKHVQTLSIPLNFFPVIGISAQGVSSKEVTVTDLKTGLVVKIQAFQQGDACTTAATQIFAHRTRPSLLVQEVRIESPVEKGLTLDIEQAGFSDWEGSSPVRKSAKSNQGLQVDYTLSVSSVPSEGDEDKVRVVGVANVVPTESITVTSSKSGRVRVLTAVSYSEPVPATDDLKQYKEQVQNQVEKELKEGLNVDSKRLREEHTSVWNQLWSSGFGISRSKASGALNGDKINNTMYYVLSQTSSPIHLSERTREERLELEKLLYFPNHCYSGHHTLQNTRMWGSVNSVDQVNGLVRTWLITLDKEGCSTMLRAGADGALQAMMLSFGSIKFDDNHMEFNTHPSDLHRDYFFRRINYGNNTHINMSVIVGEDNKASLYVSLDRNDRPYYGCDAGCLDPPIKLSKEVVQFPVKQTNPFTAVLYVTADKEHMDLIKEYKHVHEVKEAPAHQHHVIAMHRHGHHYAGLPVLFWVSIGFLIAIFHMFLFKLIFNEYCQFGSDRYLRSRYNV